MRFFVPFLPCLGFLVFLFPTELTLADEFPVAPLSRIQSETWGEVYQLSNRYLEIIVSPDHDGVVSFRKLRQPNALSAPVTLLPGDPADLTEALPRLEGVPQPRWQARGWITSEGGQTVLLTQTFGPPFHLRVTHLLSLPQDTAALQWTTRMTAIAPVDPEAPVVFRLPAESLQWRGVWKIESGPELDTALETTGEDDSFLLRETLVSQPGLNELPPQGWTLLIDGVLDMPDPQPLSE
ncbi:MAG: hypothetical protein JJU05_12840 [Verrucomicrobia bacterium]|nr:hypothetical protein [Verrucomicrobiota bacterium]MCH8528455.1 hypothetical protein [Kiritimatiellia bacterium]